MVKGRQKGKSRCHPSHRRYQREATKTANKINKHLDDTPSIPTRFDGFINTSNSSKFVSIVYYNVFGLVIEESVRGKIKWTVGNDFAGKKTKSLLLHPLGSKENPLAWEKKIKHRNR